MNDCAGTRISLFDYLIAYGWKPARDYDGEEVAGLCPLHLETHPSFYVNRRKQVFYCHACGRGGGLAQLRQWLQDPTLRCIQPRPDPAGLLEATYAFYQQQLLADLGKQAVAQRIFEECAAGRRIIISTQVVQEFHSAGTRGLKLPVDQMRLLTTGLLNLPMVEIASVHILMALEYEEQYQVSFWDALIVAAANWAEVSILYSEDLNHDQLYGGVRVVNPFR